MKTCPQCHIPLDEDAPEGLCPRCLAAAAFHSDPTMVTGGPEGLPDIANAEEVARRLPQYEILDLLGRGGMGVVYKARQKQLDRIVALKILPPSDALSPDFIERFRREARSLAKLSHTNIVAIHDFGEDGGLYYFAMEYVDGANLREMLRTKKMSGAEALAVVPKICDALQYAHDEGVVHRDIKPENILVDLKGRVKIADFGLAKLLRRDDADQNLTLSGMALGTPRYMAPEQVDKPETVDHRADIYSLGVVFYEMLTGELPMGRFAPPSQKVQVDVRLDEIVLHALERDVERRYQRVGDVKTDVENVTGKPQFAPVPAIAPFPLSEAQPPLDPRSMQSRFSGHAIVGAVWAVFGLLAILSGAYFVALSHVWDGTALPTDLIHESPPIGFNILMGALLVIGSGAFIGTPVLGAVAIGRIRRSEGRLIGLPLGIADVLFFPLLLLGAFAFWFTHLVQIAVWTKVHTAYINQPGNPEVIIAPPPQSYPGMSFMILDTVVALVMCFVAGFAVWRSIANKIGNNPLPANGAKSTAAASSESRLSRSALWGMIWSGVGIPAGIVLALAISDAPKGVVLGSILHLPTWLVALVAFSAPIGATILGGVAIGRVNRSGGKLHSLPLAACALLVYPLLTLGAATFSLLFVIFREVTRDWVWIPGGEMPPVTVFARFWNLFVILDIVVSLVISFFTGRAAWRKVSRADVAGERGSDDVRTGQGSGVWRLIVCLAGVIACAFPCKMMTSGFWGMPWWSSSTTGVGALSVVPDSPAAKAGILQEDHVKELNGTKLTGGDTLFQMWKNLPVGAAVEMKIERSGKQMTLTTKREPDSLAGQFYWNWQIIAGHGFLVFGGLLLVARTRPSLASGFSLIAGAGALVLLACVVPTVDATMVGPSLWKNAAFGEGGFEQWPWQRVTVVIVCGLLAVMSLGAISREAVEPDLVLGGVGLAAFGISLAWGICRLTGTMTNLEWAAILLTILTAIGVAVLFPRPRRGEPGSMRSKMPEIVLVLLGAGVGALPWTHTLLPASGWQFWHGGIFSMIYFVLGLVLLASGGSRPAPWMGVVTILAALGAFACAFAFTTWPPEWHLFSDGTGTGKVKTLMAGVFIAYGLSVLTAAMGALQIRAAAGNSPSAAHE